MSEWPADSVSFTFDGVTYQGRAGMPAGIALYALGIKRLGDNEVDGAPRGLYCLIGQCFECRVLVGGEVRRACLLPLSEGLAFESLRAEPPLRTNPGRPSHD